MAIINNGIDTIKLTDIQKLNSFNEIMDYIIKGSYIEYDNNLHTKAYDSSSWRHAEGIYLSLKKCKKYSNSLDTLFLSARKKLLQIYSFEIKQFNDREFFETMAYTEVFFIMHELNEKQGFDKFKDNFKDNNSVNLLCSIILTLLNSRNIDNIRKNKTLGIAANAKRIDGKMVWEYTKLNFTDIDGDIEGKNGETVNQATNIALKCLHNNIVNATSVENCVTLDDYKVLSKDNRQDIISYLAANIDLLTDKQRQFISTYAELNLDSYSDILKTCDETYERTLKNKYCKNIISRFAEKLQDDENIKIVLDNNNNLKSISRVSNELEKAIRNILNKDTNEDKFKCLISYLKKNNHVGDLLSDFIYNLDVKLYKPIVTYLGNGILSNKYIYMCFNNVIEELENKLGELEGGTTPSSFFYGGK